MLQVLCWGVLCIIPLISQLLHEVIRTLILQMRKLRLRRCQGAPGHSSLLLSLPGPDSGTAGALEACAYSSIALRELPSQGQIFLSAPENEAMFRLSHSTFLPSLHLQLHFLTCMELRLRPTQAEASLGPESQVLYRCWGLSS